MSDYSENTTLYDLKFNARIRNALQGDSVITLGQLREYAAKNGPDAMLRLQNVGRKGVREVYDFLLAHPAFYDEPKAVREAEVNGYRRGLRAAAAYILALSNETATKHES